MKTSAFYLLGLLIAFQLSGCRQDEFKQDSPQDKNQPNKPGPGEGGGGDPQAQKFIFLSQKLARFYQENPTRLELPFKADDFSFVVSKLDGSIKDPASTDLLEFTDLNLVDENDVAKVALFDKKKGSIKVHRPYWNNASDEDKFILINMEIAGLLGIELRYEHALALIKDRSALILAMPIADAGETTPIDWWIADHDPNLFARISQNDVVIDAGIIGTGSASNQRAVRFLKNTLQDKEWQSLAQKSFAQGLPAYLLLRDQEGARASLTAFRQTENGVVTYSLLFSAKSKPVGLCAHTSIQISALDRIKNCLLDSRFYSITDTDSWSSTFQILNNTLEYHFAYETNIMAKVLQTFLIQDYRGLFTPQFQNHILYISARANGLKPSLSNGEVAFWEADTKTDAKMIRFYKALEIMAHDHVGFYPGQQSQCDYYLEGSTFPSTNEKPRIVSLSELHVMIQEDRCLLRNWDNFDGKFYRTLSAHGYEYDYTKQKWRKRSPRRISDGLIGSQFTVVDEIETRIITENLSAEASNQLILDSIKTSNTTTRLMIYDVLFAWQELGLQTQQATQLYRVAIEDLLTLHPQQNVAADSEDLTWFVSTVYPLEKFVSKSFSLAMNHKLINTALSKKYVTGILQAPWLTDSMAQNLLSMHYDPIKKDDSTFELVLTAMMEKSFFNELIAQQIFSQLQDATSVNYTVRHALLQKLRKTGIVFTGEKALIEQTEEHFKTGAYIEQQVEKKNLDLAGEVALLCRVLKTSKEAAPLAPLFMRFLMMNPMSDQLQAQLLDEYMRLVQRSPSPSTGLRTLANISFEVALTKTQRTKLYEFILLKFKGAEAKSARSYFMFEMQYVSKWSPDVQQSFQLLLELIAQSSHQKIGEVGLLSELEAEDMTEARNIVRDIINCRNSHPSRLCKHISAPYRILNFIVENPNLSEPTRQAARLEQRARH